MKSKLRRSVAIEIFFCYARKDKKLLTELIKHLTPWQRVGTITMWHDQDLNAGQEWEQQINAHLDSARVILLLISPDFIASDYCYSVEMVRAMARYRRGEVCVIPVIMRPVDWWGTPFGMLQALPTDGKPVTMWRSRDAALYNVVQGLKRALVEYGNNPILSQVDREALAALAALPVRSPAQSIARRSVLVGLASILLAAGAIEGGILWSKSKQGPQIGTFTPTTQPTASVDPSSTTPLPASGQGKLLYTYRGHSNIVSAASWSPHGTSIVSGSYDKTAHVWDAKTGATFQTYRGHTDKIQAVAWSPQGTYIASASSDKTAQVWNPTGRTLTTYKGHTDVVTAVAWSPDGKHIASASYDGTVQIWEAMSGNHILTYPTGGPSPDRIVAVAWSSDGTYIASGSASELDIWTASTGENQMFGGTFGPPALAWSPVDKLLAVGGEYMSVIVDDNRGGMISRYQEATTESVLCVAWSPDGKLIAFGGADNAARVWNPKDASPAPQAFTYKGHKAPVRGVTWSSDSKYVASCSEDQTVQVWQGN